MIRELIENKEKYFWKKSSDGKIIVGGYNGSRFFGQLIITLTPEQISIQISVSNGLTSSMTLSNRNYSNLTEEYKQFQIFYKEIDDYLKNDETNLNQLINREKLMHNLLILLPKYEDIIK